MNDASRYALILGKEDFKFSSAHFTVFGAGEGELLHGHNYRVEIEVSGESTDELGMLVPVQPLKDEVRRLCQRLDERTLVPAASPYVRSRETETAIEVRFAGRLYVLPREDVCLLPLANVTIELLARHLWDELAPRLREMGLAKLRVTVEETAGQRAFFQALL